MADDDNQQSNTGVADEVGGEDQSPQAGPNSAQAELIEIRKPFSVAGQQRIIYDIGVDRQGARTWGWVLHDGSKVTINGGGGGFAIYNQIVLKVNGSPTYIT